MAKQKKKKKKDTKEIENQIKYEPGKKRFLKRGGGMKGRRRRRSGSLWRVRRDGISGPQVKRGERGFLFVSNKTRRRGELLARPFFPPFVLFNPPPQQVVSPLGGGGIRSGGSWQPSSQNPQKLGIKL